MDDVDINTCALLRAMGSTMPMPRSGRGTLARGREGSRSGCGLAVKGTPTSTIDVVLPTVDGPALVPMRWEANSIVVEEDRQGRAIDHQRPRRERRRKADVPVGIQAQPLHHPGAGLLRIEDDAGRQAAAHHQRGRRWGAMHHGRLGREYLHPSSAQPNAGPSGPSGPRTTAERCEPGRSCCGRRSPRTGTNGSARGSRSTSSVLVRLGDHHACACRFLSSPAARPARERDREGRFQPAGVSIEACLRPQRCCP
jgi:hypothetical protein